MLRVKDVLEKVLDVSFCKKKCKSCLGVLIKFFDFGHFQILIFFEKVVDVQDFRQKHDL